jgi:hypothetical protein
MAFPITQRHRLARHLTVRSIHPEIHQSAAFPFRGGAGPLRCTVTIASSATAANRGCHRAGDSCDAARRSSTADLPRLRLGQPASSHLRRILSPSLEFRPLRPVEGRGLDERNGVVAVRGLPGAVCFVLRFRLRGG